MSLTGLPFIQSLLGSLTPQGVLTQMEREQAMRAAELAKRTQELGGQAAEAQSAYQQALGGPPPGLLAGDLFVPQILGALASVIGQSPAFAEQAEQGIQERRSALLRIRALNLEQLRDVALQRAQAAQEAGDVEQEFKNRSMAEKNSKLLEVVLQGERLAAGAEQGRLQRASEERRAGVIQAAAAQQRRVQSRIEIIGAVRQDKDIQNYSRIRQFLAMGINSAASQNSAGDIVLIRSLARATDPETGIREEEYKTFTQAAGRLPALLTRFTSDMVGKGKLTETGRRAIINELLSLEHEARDLKQAKYSMFGLLADQAEIPAVEVLPELGFRATKQQMIAAARRGDWDRFYLMARDTPELNEDPELLRLSQQAPPQIRR